MHGGFRLRVPHVCKSEAKNNSSLAIVVECAEFCFGSGCHDESQYCGADVKSTIQFNGCTVCWHPPHEKNGHMLCCGLWLPIGMMHRNVCLGSYPMRRSGRTHFHLPKGNLTIVCTYALFVPSPVSVQLQWSLGPSKPSCQLRAHSTGCCPQFVGLF